MKKVQQLRLIRSLMTTHGKANECTVRQLEQAKGKYIKKRNAAKEINRRAIKNTKKS